MKRRSVERRSVKTKSRMRLGCLFVVGLLILSLGNEGMAYETSRVDNHAMIAMSPGESVFTYEVIFDKNEKAYASAEFNIRVDNPMGISVTSINYETEILEKVSGTVSTIRSSTDGNYKIGFFSTENQFAEGGAIATITLNYTGTEPRNVTIDGLKVWRFNGLFEDGLPELEEESINWAKTIAVSRSVATPIDPPVVDPPVVNPPVVNPPVVNPPVAPTPSPDDGVEIDDTNLIPEGVAEIEDVHFSDVGPQYEWALEAINALSKRGIILGYGDGQFKPGNPITRADFVVMLTRLYPLGMPSEFEQFADVDENKYYAEAILTAAGAGLVKGVGNKDFNPTGHITRQDTFVILYRLLDNLEKVDETQGDLSRFDDASKVSAYAQETMQFFVGTGIVKGSGTLLNPTGAITRAEAAVVLHRIAMLYGF